MFPQTIYQGIPFYYFTAHFLSLKFYGISLKQPEGDTGPFCRSEINSGFIAPGNATIAVRLLMDILNYKTCGAFYTYIYTVA